MPFRQNEPPHEAECPVTLGRAKSEARDPKTEGNPKSEYRNELRVSCFQRAASKEFKSQPLATLELKKGHGLIAMRAIIEPSKQVMDVRAVSSLQRATRPRELV
jgi:hypothetical protein